MSVTTAESKWRIRLRRWTVVSSLLVISFSVGAAITAYIAFRLLVTIAAIGMTVGMLAVASSGAQATTSALYSGDSATRLLVLMQLQQTLDAQPTLTVDMQTSAWILPAIEQCKSDADPEVVSLADELARQVKAKTQ